MMQFVKADGPRKWTVVCADQDMPDKQFDLLRVWYSVVAHTASEALQKTIALRLAGYEILPVRPLRSVVFPGRNMAVFYVEVQLPNLGVPYYGSFTVAAEA